MGTRERKPPHKEPTEQPAVVKDETKAANMKSSDVSQEAETSPEVKEGHGLEASKQESKTLGPPSFQDYRTPNEVEAEADVIQGEESQDTKSMGQGEGMGVDEERPDTSLLRRRREMSQDNRNRAQRVMKRSGGWICCER
ncbi:hypothetical protein PM082_002073 [Marasmius tenuissimus]|nr:hypothetical protein PM082_002073 [Marasmius tenuissimus]